MSAPAFATATPSTRSALPLRRRSDMMSTSRWTPAAQPAGIDIVGYRVIVTREDPLRVYQVELPASAQEVPIPAVFLQSDTEYELETQAIEESGNWTFATSFFSVR